LCFIFPLYVVLCIVFGKSTRCSHPVPVWNPLQWDPTQVTYVLTTSSARRHFRPGASAHRRVRGGRQLTVSAHRIPVAYYVARLSGKRKGLLLALLIAPFWISYMMRMFAWVNLLQNDGIVNKVLSFGGLLNLHVDWLTGQPVVVILGLVYGYVPYMILPLYAGLIGSRSRCSRRRVTLGRPVFVVLAGDAAAVSAHDPGRGAAHVPADARGLLHSDMLRPRRRPRWSAT